jgi:hypothetical protein
LSCIADEPTLIAFRIYSTPSALGGIQSSWREKIGIPSLLFHCSSKNFGEVRILLKISKLQKMPGINIDSVDAWFA